MKIPKTKQQQQQKSHQIYLTLSERQPDANYSSEVKLFCGKRLSVFILMRVWTEHNKIVHFRGLQKCAVRLQWEVMYCNSHKGNEKHLILEASFFSDIQSAGGRYHLYYYNHFHYLMIIYFTQLSYIFRFFITINYWVWHHVWPHFHA